MKIDTSNVSFHQEVINSQKFKDTLCKDWVIAKALLIAVQGSFKNPVVVWLFDLVINTGQSVHDKVCVAIPPAQ